MRVPNYRNWTIIYEFGLTAHEAKVGDNKGYNTLNRKFRDKPITPDLIVPIYKRKMLNLTHQTEDSIKIQEEPCVCSDTCQWITLLTDSLLRKSAAFGDLLL